MTMKNILRQSKALGRIRTRLLAFVFGVLLSTLPISALASVGCLLSAGPYYVADPVYVTAIKGDDNPGPGFYAISWGDGTTTTASGNYVSVAHIYSAEQSGISIAVQAMGYRCNPQTFDVLGASPPPPPNR